MGILINPGSKVLVQGITGRLGKKQTKLMLEYGTNVAAGVTPGKGGETVHGIPVYDTVKESVEHHDIDVSAVYVPAPYVEDAVNEAIEAGVRFSAIISDWIPYQDAMRIKSSAENSRGFRYIGPNTPGIAIPDETALGMLSSPSVMKPGNVAIVSRSGTLTGEIAESMTENDIGQSVVMGLGGDPIIGTRMVEAVKMLEEDDQTEIIVLVGEIGGTMEEEACRYINERGTKPVIGFLAGKSAPKQKTMGHAGAIVRGNRGTIKSKLKAFEEAGVDIADTIWEISEKVKKKSLNICLSVW